VRKPVGGTGKANCTGCCYMPFTIAVAASVVLQGKGTKLNTLNVARHFVLKCCFGENVKNLRRFCIWFCFTQKKFPASPVHQPHGPDMVQNSRE
jgi:hypothetical protein